MSFRSLDSYPDILTLEQLAEYLCKAIGTIYNWRSRGVSLPTETLIGGKPHYRKKHILEWLDNSEVKISSTGKKAVQS